MSSPSPIGKAHDTPGEKAATAELTVVPLDRGGSTPLYMQLATVLRGQIERGEWKPDQKIPSKTS